MTEPSSNPLAVLELRTKLIWRVFLALFVTGMGGVCVVGLLSYVNGDPRPTVDRVVLVTLLFGGILVALVFPGAAYLLRVVRGIPDVRLDMQGVVWGRDRSRDLSIDWGEVGGISAKVEQSQYVTDRVFVLRPAIGRTGRPARTLYGRVVAAVNRWRYKTPYAISTAANEPPWERVWAALEARLPGIPIQPE